MVNQEFLKVWHLSKCGCLLWQCRVASAPQAERAAGAGGDWRCTKHLAELQGADSGILKETKGAKTPVHSDRSSPVCWNWSLFCSCKTQKTTKREIWPTELPTSFLKKSRPLKKAAIVFGFFSYWKYKNGTRIFIFVQFQVALSFLLVRGTDKNSFISLLLFFLERDVVKTEKYENRWRLASHAGGFFLFSNW